MAYQVLARKYRPHRFDDVIGQDHVTRTLLNALTQNRIAHGYIFSGHRGIGKTTIARILASALNCQNAIGSEARPTAEPCNACDSCREIRESSAVDVIEIDAATNRGIDEIRELRDAARYRPARDKYKIYILDEAHQITDAAFNALLKTLEEPPDHIVFMMATTQPEDIPQTIRSRCQHYSFHAVKFDDILLQLRKIATDEGVRADEASLALLAEAGDGSMRDALSIMDQAIASAPIEENQPILDAAQIRELMGTVPNAVFEELLESVAASNSAAVITLANRLLDAGNSPSQLARQLVRYLRNSVIAKIAGLNAEGEAPAGGAGSELLQTSSDERKRAARTAMLFTEEDLTRFLQVMLRTFDDLGFRQEQRFHFELGLLKLVHLQRLLPVEELLSQLPVSPGNTPRPTPPSAPRSTPAVPATSTPVSTSVSPPRSASPFETDRNRKLPNEQAQSTTEITATEITAGALALESARRPEPVSSFSEGPRLVKPIAAPVSAAPIVATPIAVTSIPAAPVAAVFTPPAAAPVVQAPVVQVPAIQTPVIQAPVVQAVAEPTATTSSAPVPGKTTTDLSADDLQQAVTDALSNAKGHQSASDALSDATWSIDASNVRIQLGVSKTMLPVLINAEAEKIIRETLRINGAGHLKPIFEPGAAAAASAAKKPKKAAAGSAYSRASEHPIVQQAQKLFNAEIRNVMDLREKD